MADIREDAGAAVTQALVDVLSGLAVPVHTVRPQAKDGGSDDGFPHIHVEAPILGSWDTNTEDGHEVTQRMHVRWRRRSHLGGQRLMGEVYDLLHKGPLPMDGWALVLMYRELAFVAELSDGSFDGICEFRLLIVKT